MDERAPKHRWLDGESLAAFGIYLGVSLFFFGRGLIGHFGDRYIGAGPDPANQMYHLVWWPYAISHRINPLIDRFAWAPDGVNLAKVPSMPFAALFGAPITLIGGPVRGLNALLLSLPTLSAWAAFGLYRKICNGFWPSIAGGYLFGFSPFMLGHMLGQPHLLAGVFIVFAVYLTLARLDCEISARRFAILMTLVLSGQFGFSLEILATASMFGAIALAIAWLEGEAELRARIAALIAPLACAYAATITIAAPYLVYFFRAGPLAMPYHLTISASARPLNFLVPTPANALGRFVGGGLAVRGTNIYEAGSFIGLPALLIVILLAIRRGGELRVKLPLAMLIIASVLSLGPVLKIGTGAAVPLPELPIFLWAPMLRYAPPARFAIFSYLCLGALAALWLSDRSWRPGLRIALGVLLILVFAPNPDASFWTTKADTPAFFRNGLYQRYINPADVVLIIPYGICGNADMWNAQTGLYTRTAGAYLGITPPVPSGYREWPIVRSLYGLNTIPDLKRQMAAFLVNKRVSKVIVADAGANLLARTSAGGLLTWRPRPFDPEERAAIAAFFSPFDSSPIHAGGVTIYRIPLDRLGGYAGFKPDQLQRDVAAEQLGALIGAANDYLVRYGNPASLNLTNVARQGFVPKLWIGGVFTDRSGASTDSADGLILRSVSGGLIETGVMGSAAAIAQLHREFGAFARRAKISGPAATMNLAEWTLPTLTLDFDREGLAKAAAYAAHQEASAAANASEAREKGAFAGVHD